MAVPQLGLLFSLIFTALISLHSKLSMVCDWICDLTYSHSWFSFQTGITDRAFQVNNGQ